MVVGALVVGGCAATARPSADTRTVDMLWYGVQPDGSILGGTLEATVDIERTDGGVDVDVDGIRESGAGETWAASAWTAAMFALIFYGGVPDGMTMAIRVADQIDGPSAGGLITLAALADLSGVALRPGVTMTGTIYPNGAIGPVGGIPEKLRAAAAEGLTTVIVPDSKRRALDPRTNTEVDVEQLAADLGIEVVFAGSLLEARPVLFDEPPVTTPPPPPALRASIVDVFDIDAEDLARRLDALEVAAAPSADAETEAEAEQLRSILAAEQAAFHPGVEADPDAARFFIDYVVAAETERSVLTWNASAEAIATAERDGLAAATDDVRAAADRLTAAADDLLVETATTPPGTIEDLMALVDVAEWATDALETAAIVRYRLDTGDVDARQIGAMAAEIVAESYTLERLVPFHQSAIGIAGSMPLRPTTIDEIEVFVDLVAGAVAANEALIRLKLDSGAVPIDTAEIEALLAIDDVTASALAQVETDTGRAIIELAEAISRHVSTAKILNLDRTASSQDALVQRLNLLDPALLDAQIDLAIETSDRSVSTLISQGADPSYFQWETDVAQALARGEADGVITIDERLEGLARLWFANINERILVALTRPSE